MPNQHAAQCGSCWGKESAQETQLAACLTGGGDSGMVVCKKTIQWRKDGRAQKSVLKEDGEKRCWVTFSSLSRPSSPFLSCVIREQQDGDEKASKAL